MRHEGLLSVVVPVFNEHDNITRNLDVLIAEVEQSFQNFEIIVVSDGSTDGTAERLSSIAHPTVKPIVLPRNGGKGNAVRAGFARARGQFVLFIDGGMEIHPREIRIFVGLMALYEADIVIGSKRHPQSRIIYPWYRVLLSFVFQKLVRTLFSLEVTDTQVGIKLFRREVIDAILPDLEINRYGFDLELLSLAKIKGFDQMIEAPIRLNYFEGGSRFVVLDVVHVVKIGLSLVKDTFMLWRRIRRLKERRAR